MSLISFGYLLQNHHWQRFYQQWQNFLSGSNGQLLLVVSSGAVGSFCTYVAASIWADAENQWLATGAILQGFASLTTLALVLWSLWGKKINSLEAKLDQLLADLSHRDPLKQLIAIRQLTRLVVSNRLSAEYYGQSVEYYRLMLSKPQSPVVKNALLESLDILGESKILQHPPVKIPLQLKYSHKPILDSLPRE